MPPTKRGGLHFHYQTKLNAKIQSAIVPALDPAAYAALIKLRLLRRLLYGDFNIETETNRFPQASRNPLKFAHKNRTEIELLRRFAQFMQISDSRQRTVSENHHHEPVTLRVTP